MPPRNPNPKPHQNQILSQDGNWHDTGCPQVSPSCLTCPLERCKYDDPDAYYRWKAQELELQNIESVVAAMEAYALKHGVSVRTSYRRYARQSGKSVDTRMNK